MSAATGIDGANYLADETSVDEDHCDRRDNDCHGTGLRMIGRMVVGGQSADWIRR